MFLYLLTFTSVFLWSDANPINAYTLPKSPCPESIKYDFVDGKGRLDATLSVGSPHVLHGVWIRVLFDRDVTGLTVKDAFGEVEARDGNRGFLIRNPDLILKSYDIKQVQISVTYAGGEIPNIAEYRVNAVTICPNSRSNGKLYPNDELVPANYLSSLTSNYTLNEFECGRSESSDLFPWQATIFSKQNDTEHYTCEATLISPRHLATAAHCVTFLRTSYPVAATSLKVYFGKHTLEQSQPAHAVKKVTVYPGYQAENLLNDIAIIELAEEVSDQNISPICLPKEPLPEKREILSGYQIEKNQFTKQATTTLERSTDEQCLGKLGSLSALLGDGKYCANYLKGDGVCIGDSGSGASALTGSGRWILQGILNAGVSLQKQKNCDLSANLVFTEVYQYSRWILGKISQ
ncbi:chymotrypsin-C-like [Rhynchophorus ferrugineus]|uniref:chymotrypsin-C-like n=1 Tax=Rhynchophorus ferrugineus TaxID=354439 RepID=UPI003FCD5120